MSKRRYTDDERAATLAALAANGGNVSKTSKQCGVPRRTLEKWAKGLTHPEARQMAQGIKKPLAELLEEKVRELIDMPAATVAKAGAKDRAIAAGVLFDKKQLLTGGPTANNLHQIQTVEGVDESAVLGTEPSTNGHAQPN